MALGDLVVGPFVFEFNGLAIGADTDYLVTKIKNLIGYTSNSSSSPTFGRHGSSSERIYAEQKDVIIDGDFLTSDDTDYQIKRRQLASAFAPTVAPIDRQYLVYQLPDTGSTKIAMSCAAVGLILPIDPMHAIGHATFKIKLEVTDPVLYTLTETSTMFTMPSSSEIITNNGNAKSKWSATLVGPCSSPIITNDDTGQSISFSKLDLGGSDTLVYDSDTSTVKVNGSSVSGLLDIGFEWFDLAVGDNNISFLGQDAGSASFTITHRDAFWIQ